MDVSTQHELIGAKLQNIKFNIFYLFGYYFLNEKDKYVLNHGPITMHQLYVFFFLFF